MNKIDMRDAFFEKLVEAARTDERIIVLSADHGAFALKKFEEEMPSRYINMGIAEQNMVGVAAGLAASGKIVFIYGITPFVSLRVLEQLTIDVAAMQLPVNVISVGAGFTYSTDGPTHQGLQDIAAVSSIPGMTILNSSDPVNTRKFVEMAVSSEKPHYIRIEKEKLVEFSREGDIEQLEIKGFSRITNTDSRVLIVATGLFAHLALEVASTFERLTGKYLEVMDVHQIKPLTESLFEELANFDRLIVLEESYKSTLASEIALEIMKRELKIKLSIKVCGEKLFFKGATRDAMNLEAGNSAEIIVEEISEILQKDK
jgi:transketolase